jgi:hypothetical protein
VRRPALSPTISIDALKARQAAALEASLQSCDVDSRSSTPPLCSDDCDAGLRSATPLAELLEFDLMNGCVAGLNQLESLQ